MCVGEKEGRREGGREGEGSWRVKSQRVKHAKYVRECALLWLVTVLAFERLTWLIVLHVEVSPNHLLLLVQYYIVSNLQLLH